MILLTYDEYKIMISYTHLFVMCLSVCLSGRVLSIVYAFVSLSHLSVLCCLPFTLKPNDQ